MSPSSPSSAVPPAVGGPRAAAGGFVAVGRAGVKKGRWPARHPALDTEGGWGMLKGMGIEEGHGKRCGRWDIGDKPVRRDLVRWPEQRPWATGTGERLRIGRHSLPVLTLDRPWES